MSGASKDVYILGISAFYHDSAAVLVKDGEIIAAVQEERFTRKRHDSAFPSNGIKYCLKFAGIKAADLSYVGFYDKPFIKFERILETSLAFVPKGWRQFLAAMPAWLSEKLWIKDLIYKKLPGFKGQIIFSQHHEAHAASSFYPSGFNESALLTIDGVGEWETACFGIGKNNDFKILKSLRFPHSLGLLYSAFTYYCGFRVNSGEYKLMGLAPYGEPKYTELILKRLIMLKPDGSFKLNMEYFDFCTGLRMINSRFERLFGEKARRPESLIRQIDMDIASSIQKVTEKVIISMAEYVQRETKMKNLCLAGGVALNCVGNGRILREGPFDKVWIQPASGDAGAALGVALLIWHKYLDKPRFTRCDKDSQKASLLGPAFSNEEIESVLKSRNAIYESLTGKDLPDRVADLIAQGNIVGWFQGRMEFGPRALGARSILADPRNSQMQSKLNLKIKFRESFRPFAPSILFEKTSEYFELDSQSPYMMITAPVCKNHRKAFTELENDVKGFDKLKVIRSDIPAVTHVDYSARVQTVKREDNELFYALIDSFFKKTGCPLVINTSFNVRGEPIVCSPQDGINCFLRTEMDYLVIGDFLLDKKMQNTMKYDQKPLSYVELD